MFAHLIPAGNLTDTNTANNLAASPRRIAVVTQLPHPLQVNKTVDVIVSGNGNCDGEGDCTNSSDSSAVVVIDNADDGDETDSSADQGSADNSNGNSSSDSSGDDNSDNWDGGGDSSGGDF